MEKSIFVSSDWNIWDHLWRRPTKFHQTGPTEIKLFVVSSVFDKRIHCPASLHLCREFGKGINH